MLASFMLLVDFNAVSLEGVKFRGRACQRRDLCPATLSFIQHFILQFFIHEVFIN
jgi:hypothetical protein